MLEEVDEFILRALLYLEARIKHLISSMRLMYLQTLLKRDDEELTKRILQKQENNPCAGDYSILVKDDFAKL